MCTQTQTAVTHCTCARGMYDLWEIAFVIQNDQNPIRLLADEVEAWLVVLVIHMAPGDALTQVFLLQGRDRGGAADHGPRCTINSRYSTESTHVGASLTCSRANMCWLK